MPRTVWPAVSAASTKPAPAKELEPSTAMRVTSRSTWGIGVEPLHDHVAHYELQILGDLHVLDRKMDRHIGGFLADPTAEAEYRIRFDAHRLGLLDGAHDIRGVTASREHEEDIAGATLHSELAGEDRVITHVVCQTSEHRGIGGERLHAHTETAVLGDAVQVVVGQMDRIARTAAVAANEYRPSFTPAPVQVGGQYRDRTPIRLRHDRAQSRGVAGEVPDVRATMGDAGAGIVE